MISKGDTLQGKIQSVLLSVITAAIIGCFSFLWNLNGTVSSIRTENQNFKIAIDNQQSTINTMRVDAVDNRKELASVRETVIRLEAQLRLDNKIGINGN